MSAGFPFLTEYDPPGSSEGTLDPLGLYQIADQLAMRLVPGVRERMQRVRFLTAMAIGALVTEGLESDPQQPEAPPFMAWEWLVVEAVIRTMSDDPDVWGVPGTRVTRSALAEYGYLDSRSYLRTPRIFGFHGVYKRLAMHLGLVDAHMGVRPGAERLVDAWAADQGLGNLSGCKGTFERWRAAVQRSLDERPARTRPRWSDDDWAELAEATSPHCAGRRERRYLHDLLHAADESQALGALPRIWALQEQFDDEEFAEEPLHEELQRKAPHYAALLEAIRAYESFGRGLHDGFDIIRAEAGSQDARGYDIDTLSKDEDFAISMRDLHERYERARHLLAEVELQLVNEFDERFGPFAAPMSVGDCAVAICDHHERIQKAKSATGKRPWFDRLGPGRIYMRHRYREAARRDIEPDRYVHDYRGRPIRRFYFDLS